LHLLRILLISFFVLGSFVQCSTKSLVQSREEFDLLSDIEKFEYEYSLNEGIKNRLLGDLGRSVYFFNRCIEIFSFSDVAYYELSNVYYLGGKVEEAVEFAEKALELDKSNLWYYHHTADLYRASENIAEVIRIYEEANYNFPDNSEILLELAGAYTHASQFDLALGVFEKLEQDYGVDSRYSLPRERIYREKGEFENAHTEINKLINKFPEEPFYLLLLAELYKDIGMSAEAMEAYSLFLEKDPESGIGQLSISDFYIKAGKFDEAVYYLETAIKNQNLGLNEKLSIISAIIQDKEIVNDHEDQIRSLFHELKLAYPAMNIVDALIADFYINIGDYQEASQFILELYDRNPDNVTFAEQYITVLGYGSDYDKLIQAGTDASEKFKESFVINYFLGIAYYIREEIEHALYIFEHTLNLEIPDSTLKSNIYSYIGDIYYKKAFYDKSDSYFKLAIETDSGNIGAMNNYAYYLSIRGERLEEALSYSEITIDKEPLNPSFLDTYAWILFKLGEYTKALEFIEKAYSNGGNERYEIVKHYAEILIKLGKEQEAEYFLDIARNLKE
jgi:tetratricopeptide (TPR) repeat protein